MDFSKIDVSNLLNGARAVRKKRPTNKEKIAHRFVTEWQEGVPIAPSWLSLNVVEDALTSLGVDRDKYVLHLASSGIYIEPRRS